MHDKLCMCSRQCTTSDETDPFYLWELTVQTHVAKIRGLYGPVQLKSRKGIVALDLPRRTPKQSPSRALQQPASRCAPPTSLQAWHDHMTVISSTVRKPKWTEEHVPTSGGRRSTGSRHAGGCGQRHRRPTVVHHAATALSLRRLHARCPAQIRREDDESSHGGTGVRTARGHSARRWPAGAALVQPGYRRPAGLLTAPPRHLYMGAYSPRRLGRHTATPGHRATAPGPSRATER